MSLVRTSLFNGVATAIRIGTLIGLNKIMAVYVGPAGYALIGQFSNIVSVASSISGGVVSTGVSKFTAENYDNEAAQQAIWRVAARYLLIVTFPISLIIFIFSEQLSIQLLGNASYSPALMYLAFALPLMAVNTLILSIMNGKKEMRSYILQNIAASLLGALFSGLLAIWFGLAGALAAISLNQSIVLIVTWWFCRRFSWLRVSAFFGPVNIKSARLLMGFGLMSLTSALVSPIAQILVRNNLMEQFGEVAAGEWQAVFKISEIYLMLFTSTLSIYYLPRLSEIRERQDLWREIGKVYRLFLPMTIIAAGAIYLLRDLLVLILFTKDFIGMTNLFGWQLFGDVLKIGSWILGFVMVGRGMVGWFISTELIFSASWVIFTLLLTNMWGLQGAPAAFALNYALYWVFMGWLIRREIRIIL